MLSYGVILVARREATVEDRGKVQDGESHSLPVSFAQVASSVPLSPFTPMYPLLLLVKIV